MKRFICLCGLLAAGLVAAVAAQMAYAGPAAPEVPGSIEVPEGNKVFLVGHAVGVQIYACNAVADGYRWDFVAPRANLYDERGTLLTTHFAGPTWQARDGSLAVGSVVDRAPVAGAIPWLLLETTGSAGADGDRLAGTTFIQRIATTGGLAPDAAACDADAAGTTTAEVPYTADYYFWKATGA
jgi:hypothetical protein